MKYLMLIYGNEAKWASFPAEAWPEAIAKQDAFNKKYEGTGELIGAYGLGSEAQAKLVRRDQAQGRTGPYQLQAAIAAVHDEAETMDDTDWPQILGLYDLLELAAPNPFTTLNRAVAAGLVHGPRAGLDLLDTLQQDKRMANHHRLLAARAHLLELAGESAEAAKAYAQAARLSTNAPERRYLATQAKRLGSEAEPMPG
jgi:predicted RNA polymerase sigma factor